MITSTPLLRLAVALTAALLLPAAHAASDAEFPTGWDQWPIHHSGGIPDNQTPISGDLPPIVQETFKTYNWVQDGKGSAYNVRINPSQKAGAYEDASTAVLELTDIKVLLVTEHLAGEPQYGAYSYDGADLSDAHPSLAPQACDTCHSGYGEACITGVCTK